MTTIRNEFKKILTIAQNKAKIIEAIIKKYHQENKKSFWGIVVCLIIFFTSLFFFIASFIPHNQSIIQNENEEKQIANAEESLEKKLSEDPFSFKLTIPSIGIEVPIIKNINWTNSYEYSLALKRGAIHFNGTSLPSEGGNIVISAHSSGNPNYPGSYDNIFAELDNLEEEDLIYLRYEDINYAYIVEEKKIISADDLSVLDNRDYETITLISCYPVGTTDKRIIVRAQKL